MTIAPYQTLERWKEFRDALQPWAQQRGISKMMKLLDRAIESDLAERDLRAITEHVGDMFELVDNLAAVLTDEDGQTSNRERAIEILQGWLPHKLIEFRPLQRMKVVHNEFGRSRIVPDTENETENIKIKSQLDSYLYFAPQKHWINLHSYAISWRNEPSLCYVNHVGSRRHEPSFVSIDLFDKVIKEYCNPSNRLIAIESIVSYFLSIRTIWFAIFSGVKIYEPESEKYIWAEARLERWVRTYLPDHFSKLSTRSTSLVSQNYLISLVRKNLDCRIKYDFYHEFTLPKRKNIGSMISLDENIENDSGESFSRHEKIADERSINFIDLEIETLQEAEYQKQKTEEIIQRSENTWQHRFIQYVNEDRYAKIRRRYYQSTACNYQYIIQKLIFPVLRGEQPMKREDLAHEFNVSVDGFRSHEYRVFLPWVDGLYLDILNEDEWEKLKQIIDVTQQQVLEATHPKGAPACNAQFLARQILFCYIPNPRTWEDISTELVAGGCKRATPEYVEDYWENTCRPIIGKIVRNQIFNYPAN